MIAASAPELEQVSVSDLRPSPENERLYRPVRSDDPEIIALADSIRTRGVQEPLVTTADGYVVSGHRRLAAARLAGLRAVPCRVLPRARADFDDDEYIRLLREHNRQREKTLDEKLAETVVSVDAEDAYRRLIAFRGRGPDIENIEIQGAMRRHKISKAKRPFLRAVQEVIEALADFWPVSDRQIHYGLLNNPPLKHASKPDSVYTNDRPSYQNLVDLLTRARLAGEIPMECIADSTRPVRLWRLDRGPGAFMQRELDQFLKGYQRDLMASQPNHLELVGEKLTIEPILRPVAARYGIPMTIGRGYASLPPRAAIANRFEASGKRRLIMVVVADHDPDGQEIAQSLGRSLRDDFDIRDTHLVKAALTADQVRQYHLPPIVKAKPSSSNYRKFAKEHGAFAYELEALSPEALQGIVGDVIDGLIDTDLFNAEIEQDRQDAQQLQEARQRAYAALAGWMKGTA